MKLTQVPQVTQVFSYMNMKGRTNNKSTLRSFSKGKPLEKLAHFFLTCEYGRLSALPAAGGVLARTPPAAGSGERRLYL